MNAALLIVGMVMGLGTAPHGVQELVGWFGAAASTALELMARAATTSDSFNAAGNPRRREILNYLALHERAVGDIVLCLKMHQPSDLEASTGAAECPAGPGTTKREARVLSDECESDPADA